MPAAGGGQGQQQMPFGLLGMGGGGDSAGGFPEMDDMRPGGI